MAALLRRLAPIGVALTILVAAASPAAGVGIIVGFTWYSDGSFSKSLPSGTVITAYATQAKANTQFRLQMAPALQTGESCPTDNRTNVNPNIRISNASGFIGNTAGPAVGAPGNFHVCFYELGQATTISATVPVFLTML